MFEILFNPLKAIAKAKKKNMQNTMLMLGIASLFTALSFLFMAGFSGENVLTTVGVLVGAFVFVLFLGFLLKLGMSILAKNSGYYEALTTLTFGFLIASVGGLVNSILGLIPTLGNMSLILIMGFITGIVMLFTVILSVVTTFRTGMELFKTDLLTIVVGLTVIFVGAGISMYSIFLKVLFASMFGMFTGMPM
ncbi:hypothetical protein ACFLZN_00445 [Nanoarchaeota archaeon]